jgi:hypothetical protein
MRAWHQLAKKRARIGGVVGTSRISRQAGSQSCPILFNFAEHPAGKAKVKNDKAR